MKQEVTVITIFDAITCNDVDFFKDNIDDIVTYINKNNFTTHPLIAAIKFNRDIIADILFDANPAWIFECDMLHSENYNGMIAAIINSNTYILSKVVNWAVHNDRSKVDSPFKIDDNFRVLLPEPIKYDLNEITLFGFAITNNRAGAYAIAKCMIDAGVDLTTRFDYWDHIDLCLKYNKYDILAYMYEIMLKTGKQYRLDFEEKVFNNRSLYNELYDGRTRYRGYNMMYNLITVYNMDKFASLHED